MLHDDPSLRRKRKNWTNGEVEINNMKEEVGQTTYSLDVFIQNAQ